MAKILSDIESDIARAAELLRAGQIVAIPTETVYGLAANAFLENSVRQIFFAKGRPFIDPLIVHVFSLEQAGTLAEISHPFVRRLAEAFWPGPLTLILPKKETVPALVTAGEPTVAVRMPAHPVAQKILRAAQVPLAAPSANPFGYVSPTSAAHVQESLGNKIDWIVDGGVCACGVESTIVQISENAPPRILRPGVITREELEKTLGVPVEQGKGLLESLGDDADSAAGTPSAQIAPGLLKKHYSPRVPVELFPHGDAPKFGAVPAGTETPVAVVFQARPSRERLDLPANDDARALSGGAGVSIFWLSETGEQAEVARSVFALLRRLDKENFSKIFIEKSPDLGIGVAVNDRLSRAAAKSAH